MILRGTSEAKDVFGGPGRGGALAVPLLMPLKLSITYIALMPALAAWLWTQRTRLAEKIRGNPLVLPFYLFLMCVAVSALFGVRPLHSLRGLPTLVLFSLLVLMFHDAGRRFSPQRVLCALLCGQGLAAFQSLLETGAPQPIRHIFIGPVTESGQIALTLVVGVSLLWYLSERPEVQRRGPPRPAAASHQHRRETVETAEDVGEKWRLAALLHFLLFALVAFAPTLGVSGALFFLCALIAAYPAALGLARLLRFAWNGAHEPAALRRVLAVQVLPLITVALLAHLKRGPWLGVLVGVSLFFLIYRRRLIVPVLAAAALLFLTVTPLRTRLEQSARDFYISGGRSTMWRIGVELAARYPLGIGYANSKSLRQFSPEIPPEHGHFHNDFLNILVETGWIPFAVFLWWLARILRIALRAPHESRERILSAGIGCAVASMLAAGMVEYNFGDSEVCMIFFVLLGLLSGLNSPDSADQPTSSANSSTSAA